MDILKKLSNVRVLVVGDIMIDRFCWGSVQRISPEAPVPVVRLDKTSLVAGGAANVAANIAGLGAEAILVGVTGDDKEAELFPELLAVSGVSERFLHKVADRPTTVKTRVIAHSQQIVRIDQETNSELGFDETEMLWEKIRGPIETADIIVVSDYAKGVVTADLLTRLITTAKEQGKSIIIDPKGKNYDKYKGATLLTPNKREAAEACNIEEDSPEVIQKAGQRLLKELELDSILITKGEEGMSLFHQNGDVFELPALARDVFDVTGAGDTVIATLAVALGVGANLRQAAELANIAAGIVVEQIGTTAIDLTALEKTYGALKRAASNALDK